ncbi:MAG: hypothetical protein K5634_03105 [Sphaerochaetaceae bacterium]|nr:hypothetical protein [Sphaerochaetaceae bacterium]
MFSFLKKQKKPVLSYDRQKYKPAIRSSICTGEKVAGFKDKITGDFTEIMLLQNGRDLEEFKARYGIEEEVEIFY